MHKKPTIYDRTNKWNSLYKIQGQRWGIMHSLSAHLSLHHIESIKKKEKNLLDIGCGYGRDLFYFRQIFKELCVDGIDSSKSVLDIAREYTTIFEINELIENDFIEFNSKRKYDIIFGNYFAHLFYKDELEVILQKIKSMMSSEGIAILSFVSIKDRHFGKGKKIDYRLYEVFKDIPWRFYDIQELRDICSQNDLKIKELYEFPELEIVNNQKDLVRSLYLSFSLNT